MSWRRTLEWLPSAPTQKSKSTSTSVGGCWPLEFANWSFFPSKLADCSLCSKNIGTAARSTSPINSSLSNPRSIELMHCFDASNRSRRGRRTILTLTHLPVKDVVQLTLLPASQEMDHTATHR